MCAGEIILATSNSQRCVRFGAVQVPAVERLKLRTYRLKDGSRSILRPGCKEGEKNYLGID